MAAGLPRKRVRRLDSLRCRNHRDGRPAPGVSLGFRWRELQLARRLQPAIRMRVPTSSPAGPVPVCTICTLCIVALGEHGLRIRQRLLNVPGKRSAAPVEPRCASMRTSTVPGSRQGALVARALVRAALTLVSTPERLHPTREGGTCYRFACDRAPGGAAPCAASIK